MPRLCLVLGAIACDEAAGTSSSTRCPQEVQYAELVSRRPPQPMQNAARWCCDPQPVQNASSDTAGAPHVAHWSGTWRTGGRRIGVRGLGGHGLSRHV